MSESKFPYEINRLATQKENSLRILMMTLHYRILMMMMCLALLVRQLDLMPESQLAGALQADGHHGITGEDGKHLIGLSSGHRMMMQVH